MGTINTLEQVAEALGDLGYEAIHENEAVRTVVGGSEAPFTAVLTTNADGSELVITCQLAKVGDIPEDKSETFAWACLDANTRVRPYSLATITAVDDENLDSDDEADYPIVLTDSVPLGDLSESELGSAMDNLWEALTAASLVLEFALKKDAG